MRHWQDVVLARCGSLAAPSFVLALFAVDGVRCLDPRCIGERMLCASGGCHFMWHAPSYVLSREGCLRAVVLVSFQVMGLAAVRAI